MKTTSVAVMDKLPLEDHQLADQIFSSAGLDPVVDAGLEDYDKRMQVENKLINKMLGRLQSAE